VYGRVVCVMLESIRESDGESVIEIGSPEIASRVGASREMVSRILSDLSAGGYIRVEAKQIVLLRKLPAHW